MKKALKDHLRSLERIAAEADIHLVETRGRGNNHIGTHWKRPTGEVFLFVLPHSPSDKRGLMNNISDFKKCLHAPLHTPRRGIM